MAVVQREAQDYVIEALVRKRKRCPIEQLERHLRHPDILNVDTSDVGSELRPNAFGEVRSTTADIQDALSGIDITPEHLRLVGISDSDRLGRPWPRRHGGPPNPLNKALLQTFTPPL